MTTVRAGASYSLSTRAGVALIVLSCVLFVALFAVPFLPMATGSQATLAAGLAISSEGTFWLGALIAGKDAMGYLRRRFWPTPARRKTAAS